MIHAQNTQAPREELTAVIIDAKMRKDLSAADHPAARKHSRRYPN